MISRGCVTPIAASRHRRWCSAGARIQEPGATSMYLSDDFRLKTGLAEMLKGGVIMDVTNVEQAVIAEKAGASAVMALERVPSDIRKDGGVARMARSEERRVGKEWRCRGWTGA